MAPLYIAGAPPGFVCDDVNTVKKATIVVEKKEILRCEYMFAEGVQCQMQKGHEEPYYAYADRGQYGFYYDFLSQGSPHQVNADAPPVPPKEEWTGNERKDMVSYHYYPMFKD